LRRSTCHPRVARVLLASATIRKQGCRIEISRAPTPSKCVFPLWLTADDEQNVRACVSVCVHVCVCACVRAGGRAVEWGVVVGVGVGVTATGRCYREHWVGCMRVLCGIGASS
jgi:hypothetical protein